MYRKGGGIVLRLLEERLFDAPQFPGRHPWRQPRAQALSIDQPIGLRIAANDGRLEGRRGSRSLVDFKYNSSRTAPMTLPPVLT
jgi:hypothetical protein